MRKLFFIASLFAVSCCAAGNDTVLTLIQGKPDEIQLTMLLRAGRVLLEKGDLPKAREYAGLAIRKSENLTDPHWHADAALLRADIHFSMQDAVNAISDYELFLKLSGTRAEPKQIADVSNKLGNLYFNEGKFPLALEKHLKALRIREDIRDERGIAGSYNNIGNVYIGQEKFDPALENYLKAENINRKLKNDPWLALNLLNIGRVFEGKSDYAKAMDYYQRSLQIQQQIDNRYGVALCYNNIGVIYNNLAEQSEEQGSQQATAELLQLSLDNHLKSLRLRTEDGEPYGIVMSEINIAQILRAQKKYPEAEKHLQHALTISRENNFLEGLRESYGSMADVDSSQGDFRGAYSNLRNFMRSRDSISSRENTEKLVQTAMQYEFDKKQATDSIRIAEERKVTSAQLHAEKTQRWALYGGIGIVLVFSLFLYNRFRLTQKQNLIIEEQKKLVEEKQHEIIDSITYARRLQEAILPPDDYMRKNLPDHFVFYKPKDIVAGDFYWMDQLEDSTFLAAADSTGHGVPGAMVSVICSNALNRAVQEFRIHETGKLLDKTRNLVVETFERSDIEVKDGMDISLLRITGNARELEWSGANNSLLIFSDGELKEIKATKQPIGRVDTPVPFNSHRLTAKENDMFYLITDGFADQFGGPRGKKFMYGQLKKLLREIAVLPVNEQKERLANTFTNWSGPLEQVDDVTIIGVRF